jgi:polyisoprenoid-binding protein YceI
MSLSSMARVAPARTVFLPAGHWTVDRHRSTLTFAVRHLRLARVRGRFALFAGRIDAGAVLDVSGTVDVASIDTGDAVRDEHLRGEGFFDAAAFPRIEYRAEQVLADAEDWRIPGWLTVRDVSAPLNLRATSATPVGADMRIAARGEFSRRAFGLQWPGLIEAGRIAVSDRVAIELDVVVRRSQP